MQMTVSFPGNKKVNAHVNGFTIETDQPQHSGGDNCAPSPLVLFLASLATCAGFYVKSFCDGREISAEGIEITQSLEINQETKRIDKVLINISLPYDFPEKYKDAVVLSANQCLVKQYLAKPFEVQTFAEIRTK